MYKISICVYVQSLVPPDSVEMVQMVKLQNLVTPYVSNVYLQ